MPGIRRFDAASMANLRGQDTVSQGPGKMGLVVSSTPAGPFGYQLSELRKLKCHFQQGLLFAFAPAGWPLPPCAVEAIGPYETKAF